jgi:hypothetical protein
VIKLRTKVNPKVNKNGVFRKEEDEVQSALFLLFTVWDLLKTSYEQVIGEFQLHRE